MQRRDFDFLGSVVFTTLGLQGKLLAGSRRQLSYFIRRNNRKQHSLLLRLLQHMPCSPGQIVSIQPVLAT